MSDTDRVREILEENHGDRVYTVEDDHVWVSGMNVNCKMVATSMARTLCSHDIPAGLVYDDGAARNGGVQFNWGASA